MPANASVSAPATAMHIALFMLPRFVAGRAACLEDSNVDGIVSVR
jgi:hypothetical protein